MLGSLTALIAPTETQPGRRTGCHGRIRGAGCRAGSRPGSPLAPFPSCRDSILSTRLHSDPSGRPWTGQVHQHDRDGRSGDGGIGGLGVYRLSLVSFPIYFPCKRYRAASGRGRAGVPGRHGWAGDKGLAITTGSFTGDAKREATRDGAPPIDLIDGDGLCELLKRYELG